MKNILFSSLLLFLVFTNINAQEKSSLALIREELFYTDFNIDKCLSFYSKVAEYHQITPTITAYEAAAKALVAKHSWNPITKYSNLQDALTLLDKAILLEEMNLEIRFLRLYIENSLPTYLGKSNNMIGDKQLIIENIQLLNTLDLNADIIQYILKYLSTSVACTHEEKKIIEARMF
jgi:hypothetical protein